MVNHSRLALTLAIVGLPCTAAAPAGDNPPGVAAFVRDQRLTRYSVALADLDGDAKPEALVYAIATADGGGEADLCGSGGCDLYILSLTPAGYRLVTTITLARPPVRVLAATKRGWHDLEVFVAGGGILPGYEARLRFDGKGYPSNPTVPPATRSNGAAGRQIIATIPPVPTDR